MKRQAWTFCLLALALALALAALSPWASSRPDGLERVVQDNARASNSTVRASAEDSTAAGESAAGSPSRSLRTILAGLAGTLAVFGVMVALGRLMAARPKCKPPEGTVRATPPPR